MAQALDARVGRAFSARPVRVQTVQVAAAKPPDMRTWVTDVDQILPATEATVDAADASASVETAGAAESAGAVASEPSAQI